MPFNRCEFTVVYLEWLSFRTAPTALTSLGDVPVPLNRRIGGTSFDAGGAQAVRASEAMHKMNWTLRFFTGCEQFLTTQRRRPRSALIATGERCRRSLKRLVSSIDLPHGLLLLRHRRQTHGAPTLIHMIRILNWVKHKLSGRPAILCDDHRHSPQVPCIHSLDLRDRLGAHVGTEVLANTLILLAHLQQLPAQRGIGPRCALASSITHFKGAMFHHTVIKPLRPI